MNDTREAPATRYELWTEAGGYAFRNKIYPTLADAEAGLAKIVWHNRHLFVIRPLPSPSPSQQQGRNP